jgi:site-specific DNA recombinase
MTAETAVRRVVTYERVSSADQRERETIKTQRDALEARLAVEPGIEVVDRYSDDGVSGMRLLADRPDGRRLLADAEASRFDELWLYRLDRLGRNLADTAAMGRRLEKVSVAVVTLAEGRLTPFMFDLFAMLAQNEHRVFHERSADGMARAAREGRYTGGIVPLGYRVDGEKQTAHLVPDRTLLWADLSAIDVVRRIYHAVAIEGRSCVSIADEFTALGIPTHYARDGRTVLRGQRQERTQGIWRGGRIRNLVVNPVYKGISQYGRRSENPRDIIAAKIESLVSEELWQAAQETLGRNRVIARNTTRRYLLKGVMHCGACGLTYVGTQGRVGVAWYRCGGRQAGRGPSEGRCRGPLIKGETIEPVVWADLERLLRNPGDAIGDLEAGVHRESEGAIAEAQAITLGHALDTLEAQRKQALALSIRGHLRDAELDGELDRITTERTRIEVLLAAAAASIDESPAVDAIDLLSKVRERLDAGLTDEQRQEIVRLLVRIAVDADTADDGQTSRRVSIEYRFPGVVETRTDRDSSRR